MIDYEALEEFPFMKETYQHEWFFDFINQEESLNDKDFFEVLSRLSVFLISISSFEEQYLVAKLLSSRIRNNGLYAAQLIEFSGFMIKYLNCESRDLLIESILSCFDNYYSKIAGIISVTKFIRESNKVMSFNQKEKCKSFLHKLKTTVPTFLIDTIEYTIDNIEKAFTPCKADVLLLLPEYLSGSSFLQPPICFINAMADLNRKGFTVHLLDNRVYHYSDEQLIGFIADNYRYIIVSSSPIDQYQAYFVDKRFVVFSNTFNAVSGFCSYDMIIACGSHGTVDYQLLLQDVSPSIIIIGNYESRIGDLISKLDVGEDLHNINGIVYKEKNTYIKTPAENNRFVSWADSVIDYSLIDLNDYYGYRYVNNIHVIKRKWAILQSTEGCPYDCLFCYNIYGKTVRFKKISNIIKELKQLESLGCAEAFFIDQTFTINKDFTRKICEEIVNNNISINWQCQTRVDLLDEELLQMMRAAGCVSIWIGIESFDERILELNNKGYTKAQLIDILNLFKRLDYNYSAFFMYGMYGENAESLNHTIETIIDRRINTSRSIIHCVPRMGTPLFLKVNDSFRSKITHFWQMESLKNSFNNTISKNEIEMALDKLKRWSIANGDSIIICERIYE